jgi:inhibitor of cysteine peptidase
VAEIWISPDGGEDGAAATLRVGDVLAVEVPENPTTGYVWSVAAVPEQLAELVLDPLDEQAGRDDRPRPRPGATGRRTLRFAAQQPGTGELRLRHGRSWQPAGGEEITIAVRVEPAS